MKFNSGIIIVAGLILTIVNAGWSHPGDLDAKGGHKCKTNCEKYGLKYGEYHIHRPTSTPSPTPWPSPEPFFDDSLRICDQNDRIPVNKNNSGIASKIILVIGVLALISTIAVPLALLSKLWYFVKEKKRIATNYKHGKH